MEAEKERRPQDEAGSSRISPEQWFLDLRKLREKLSSQGPLDAVVGIHRSGLMVAVYLSNQLSLPMFTLFNLDHIPRQFERIAVVDTSAWTGRSMRRALRKVAGACPWAETVPACLYIDCERGVRVEGLIFVRCLAGVPKFFWERGYLKKQGEGEEAGGLP